jgi:hypothetical protein
MRVHEAGLIHEPAYKPGLQGGIGIELSLTKKIAVEIEGLYFQKGTHYVYGRRKEGNIKHVLNVISLPILIKFNILRGSSPYVVYGYEYSIILSHEYSDTVIGRIQEEQNVKDFTKSQDHALVLGLGYEVRKKPFSFYIEGRYHQGLKNISRGYELYPVLKTETMVLLLGLKIHL